MEDLAKLIETEEGAGLYTHILSISAALPMVMKTAHELNLFELIANAGPAAYVSSVHLAAQLPTSNPYAPLLIDRILRLLSSFSILSCTGRNQPDGRSERLYGLTPVGKFLTKNNDGVSMAPLLALIHDKTLMEGWYYMSEAILEGEYPFEKAYGVDLFDYLEKNPKLRNDFNKGMSNPTTIILKKLLEIYDGFKGLRTLVDVGGGIGATLKAIVSKYPNINGINFDLPHVIKDAHFHHGVEHVGGDMFVGVPKGDAIFLKAILHDWDDDKCRLLLKNCYESLIENGKVILVEFLLPDVPDNTLEGGLAALIDVVMLAHNPGAKERTEKELKALAKDAGFIDFRKICCAYGIWIIELHK